ncbi:MAG: ATP-binding cassette domain-containing protein [Phycisphaeraceae bacterium]|nr:ATP-binding cassette domain-containing protein [Phycisphaeraceae bacterium]
MPSVIADNLSKVFRVADKQPGLLGTLRHFSHRKYRDVEAVKGVSFSIEPGEIVGFLGPNGAGKTTTLKMLTGLIHPTAGAAQVLGFKPFDRKAELLRQITLVMGQKQQLIWDLPTLDSLRINAAVYDLPRTEADNRVAELADMLGLSDEMTRPVRKLSLGERMKCELVAALLHRPKVLFLDEPTLGLDVNAQNAVRQFLRQYNQQHGAAILLTSHYMADITALCERVIVIHHGSLKYDGELRGIVERFAPLREVTFELKQDPAGQDFQRFGQIESTDGRIVKLLVERSRLTGTVNRLLHELDVLDLTVSDPPIEQVIGRLFEGAEE